MSELTIQGLSKTFSEAGKAFHVLENINLKVRQGEFLTIFGPNGCGKTTLLEIIAGLQEPNTGTIRISGKPARDIKVGFVFQNYNESMFPWRTVLGNVTFPLEIGGMDRAERERVALRLLEKVSMFAHRDKHFYKLSGGMKQLVAICRAIAYNPDILIMDEPFSSLDHLASRMMQMEFLKIWRETRKTTLFVSHNLDEAILLGDRIVVLSKRPARVKKIITVDLPRPRRLDIVRSRKFFDIRVEVLREYENE